MTELWLKFTDENGDARRAAVNDEFFVIGRHSSNDLCILDNRLSREHVRIERFDDAFYVSDANSSNGSTLNGAPLREAAIIRDGDVLMLGGGVEIKIEIVSGEANFAGDANAASVNRTNDFSAVETSNQISAPAAPVVSPGTSIAADAGGIPNAFFWLAPIFGLIVLIVVGGLLFVFAKKERQTADTGDYPVYTPRGNSSKRDDTPAETPTPRAADTPINSGNSAAPTPDTTDVTSPPKTSSDAEKIEQFALAFLKRIAKNDPRPFLTSKQTEAINSKISQFKGSGALAENLKAVKKNAAQFQTLAASKDLKGQFLAAAALTKIGNSRGDPLAVANQMLPILNDLKITLDNNLADDNLLIIAAYERGAANQPRSLQSTLEALAKQTQNVNPRQIRTIWFLHDKGKITDAEYNFALQFIAVGAIMQSPKDFGVNADPVIFN